MFWYRFRCHLGPILVPTWLQLDFQNQPKTDPRAIQTPSQLAPCFRSPSGSIFERICMDFWFPNRPKINQNSIKKSTQHHNNQKTKKLIIPRQGRWNRALGHVMLATKMYKNPHSNLQKTGLKSTPTWFDFVTKLAPNRFRNDSPNPYKKWSHFESLLEPILIDFGLQLSSQERAQEIIFRCFFRSWAHLGAKMAPRPPKSPPNHDFDRFLDQF